MQGLPGIDDARSMGRRAAGIIAGCEKSRELAKDKFDRKIISLSTHWSGVDGLQYVKQISLRS